MSAFKNIDWFINQSILSVNWNRKLNISLIYHVVKFRCLIHGQVQIKSPAYSHYLKTGLSQFYLSPSPCPWFLRFYLHMWPSLLHLATLFVRPSPLTLLPLTVSGGLGLVSSPPNTSNYGGAEHFPSITLSRWDEVLALPIPSANYLLPSAWVTCIANVTFS